MTCEVEVAGENLTLLPERAVWWASRRTLLVADVHLGKDQVFRRHGIAVPAGPTDADLDSLSALLRRLEPAHLVVLGDWVHAPPTPDDTWPDAVGRWRDRHANCPISVILGNHDRSMHRCLAAWDMAAAETLRCGPFELVHDTEDATGDRYALCGHTHPVVRLRDGRHGFLRLPAFCFSARVGVLPAYGQFTGGQAVRKTPETRLFVVAGDTVVSL